MKLSFLIESLLSGGFPLVFLCCFATIIISQCASAVNLPNSETVPGVIVFGDSIVDTGNNNYIKTITKCNFLPYGRDFGKGNQPTGRFTNGLTPSDIIAAKLGVKKLLPPYLDPNLPPKDLLTGVCFASSGNGYDPLTSKVAGALSLAHQLDKFKEYKDKIKKIVGENKTRTIISKSIYIVCTGTNDIANTYFLAPFRRLRFDVPAYTDKLASHASEFLQELYKQGARRIGVMGMPVLGCIPSQRTFHGGKHRLCSDKENRAAMLFNQKLSSQIDVLKNQFSEARFVYLDIYNPLLNIIQNPTKYGFGVTDKGCCGTGKIEVGFMCNSFHSRTCTNITDYIFWDSFHPTERAYYVLCSQVLDNRIKDFF